MVGVSFNEFIAQFDNLFQNHLRHHWLEAGQTLEIISYADDLHYKEIIDNINDKEIESKVQQAMIWCYLHAIPGCALAKIRQITGEK
jgi:hypothetical protein